MKRLAVWLKILCLSLCCLTFPLAAQPFFVRKTVITAVAYGNESNQEGLTWIRIVDKFSKEHPRVEIRYNLLYDEAYHQYIRTRLVAGGDNVPDIAYMGADNRWGDPWREAGQQFDHRPYLDSEYYDLKLIPSMGPDGEIYEIPTGTSNITTVLYMNQPLVNSLGFDVPRTYADLKAMVQPAKEQGIQVVSIDGADGWAWGSCLLSCIVARLSGDPHWVARAVEGEHRFTDRVFVDSLKMLKTMVDDGVISPRSIGVDYGTNISNFSSQKALFMVQGQWAAGSIEKSVQNETLMLAWPDIPGQKKGMTGSVAAAIQVGYGLTKKGGSNPKVRDAALMFLQEYFNSEREVTRRLWDGAIVAPILKDYKIPEDLPPIVKRKVRLAWEVRTTDIIDAYLSGAANDALNAGCQKIVRGEAAPEQVAREVEDLWRDRRR